MLIALLLASAQPAKPPAQEGAIDATPTIMAYVNWRVCLDGRLGPPPRRDAPTPRALEAAFAACRPQEEALRAATIAAFGPERGGEAYANMVRGARAEVSAPFPPRR
jgi:hypothetical protein